MDEFDDVARLAGPEGPRAVTVERHAAQLRAAVEAELGRDAAAASRTPPAAGTSPVVDLGRAAGRDGRRSRRRAVVATAAAITIFVGAAGITRLGGDTGDQKVATSDRRNTTPAGQPETDRASGRCGTDLPVDIVIPVGYDGPHPGPGGDVATEPETDQYVTHWLSPAGAVEVRWPADPEYRDTFTGVRGQGPGDSPLTTTTFTGTASTTPTGRQAKQFLAFRQAGSTTACSTVQVVVSDADVNRVDDTIDAVYRHVFDRDLPPLVMATGEADAAPPVTRCQAPAGSPIPPNQSGRITNPGIHAAPAAALTAFLEGPEVPSAEFAGPSGRQLRQPTLAQRGYEELRLPDGTVVYAKRSEGAANAYVTVIRVAQAEGGWSVTAWEGSGC